jgi:pimeloyl-ACP methyl ester carboxylesterase
VLLIHGFASSTAVNWRSTAWIATLTGAGRQVIALDNRGHGESAKLYDPAAYGLEAMAGDAARLLDHLAIARADVLGYSMGARIGVTLALDHPERVRSLVIGGMGHLLVDGLGGEAEIAAGYRAFAERTGSDLWALAACMRGQRRGIAAARLKALSVPVLVAVGTRDERVGSARGLAELIPGAEVLDIVGRDHMLATGDRQFKTAVLDFLARRP